MMFPSHDRGGLLNDCDNPYINTKGDADDVQEPITSILDFRGGISDFFAAALYAFFGPVIIISYIGAFINNIILLFILGLWANIWYAAILLKTVQFILYRRSI